MLVNNCDYLFTADFAIQWFATWLFGLVYSTSSIKHVFIPEIKLAKLIISVATDNNITIFTESQFLL